MEDHARLIILMGATIVVIVVSIGVQGYFLWLQYRSKPYHALAQEAHACVLDLAASQKNFLVLSEHLQAVTAQIERLGVMGPERVILKLTNVEEHLTECLRAIEKLSAVIEQQRRN